MRSTRRAADLSAFLPLRLPVGLAVLLVLLFPAVVGACTTFCLDDNGQRIFGRNYDWDVEDCLIVVNKRGVAKTSYSQTHPAKWISRYGSVTFNQYGRELPQGGMNEAGLVVETMWLSPTEYPAPDARAEVGELQWVQYQLDTAGSVADVIASDAAIRILRENSSPIHFLVCDCKGDCASIEFLGGKMVVHTEEAMPATRRVKPSARPAILSSDSPGPLRV